MNLESLVSVVIPVYNVCKYLEACLDSLTSQTYSNLEIILVDDGSNDDCPKICDEYALNDKRIKVIHQPNGGLSNARNSGINIASGEYITFIDSDHVVATDMIEYLSNLIIDNRADMSLCQMRKIDESGNFIGKALSTKSFLVGNNPESCLKAYLSDPMFDTVAWSKLYKTSMFSDVRYPNGKFHEDVFTTYKIVAKCNRVAIGGERKYYYRSRSSSIMNLPFKPQHMNAIEGKLEQNDFIESEYPKLSKYSHIGIVYAANICALRIANSCSIYKEYVNELQSLYRKYEKDFLLGRSSLKAKFFSVAAYINLNLLIKLIKYVGK